MKTRLLNDEINKLILVNWDLTVKELNPIIQDKLGDTLTGNALRKRKKRMIEKFGDKLQYINQFQQDLEANGFNPDNWKHGWFKTESSSIFIKNKDDVVTYDEVRDEFIKTIQKYSPKYPTVKRKKIKDGHMLIIDPADIHIGKLAIYDETGNDYNINIAVQRCIDGVKGIIDKSQGFNIDKILFVIGNDVLHVDNAQRKTTSGTPQDTDQQWWKAYMEARKMYVKIIEMLVTVADVHVVFCPSNHDYVSGFMLADSIACWFHKAKNVTFDVTMRHRKYGMYGNAMLEFDHGDGHKDQDTPLIMASEQPKLWANSKYRYSFKHHIHHHKKIRWQSGKDYHGCTVVYLRTPSGTDRWHDNNGYMGVPKAVEGFLISKTNGMVSSLTHHF